MGKFDLKMDVQNDLFFGEQKRRKMQTYMIPSKIVQKAKPLLRRTLVGHIKVRQWRVYWKNAHVKF